MLILYVPAKPGRRPKYDHGRGRVLVATGSKTSGTVTSEEIAEGRRPISVTEFELLTAGCGAKLNDARAKIGMRPMPVPDADTETDHVRTLETGTSLL